MTDQEVLDALDRTATPLHPEFHARLLDDLRVEWDAPTIKATPAGLTQRPGHRGLIWLAAAVVTAIAGAAIISIRSTSDRSQDPVTTAGSLPDSTGTTMAPAMTLAPATTFAPATTTPATTNASPTTSPPVTSAAPTTIAPGVDTTALQLWIDDQIAAGRTRGAGYAGEGTDAGMVVAYGGAQNDMAAVVVLGDGSVVELPADLPTAPTASYVAGVGGRPVLIGRVDDHYVLWALDLGDLTWEDAIELDVLADNQAIPTVTDLDGRLLIANETVRIDGTGTYVPDQQQGVIIDAQLGLTPMTSPPDGLFMNFTTTVGSQAFILGRDANAGDVAPLTEPWQFDAATNTWSPLPTPSWLTCTPTCTWRAPHEFGDLTLEVALDDAVVKLLPDGTIGMYTPATGQWRQMDPAPFALQTPAAATAGTDVVVAPQPIIGFDQNPSQVVGVLDTATGQWATTGLAQFGIPADVYLRRELHSDGTTALLSVYGEDSLPPTEPAAAYDHSTATWRTPTSDDIELWKRLYPIGDGSLQSIADMR